MSLTRTQRMYGFAITCQFEISSNTHFTFEPWPVASVDLFAHLTLVFFSLSSCPLSLSPVALGWVISLMSLISLSQIAIHPEKFALMYTFGNILSLCSTAFLWGSVLCLRAPVRAPPRTALHCCPYVDCASNLI